MLKIFGVRHHGIGCSRALVTGLLEYKPDLILLEGPLEAESVLNYVADANMVPPVAILIYAVDDPSYASFYPFTSFSPEWITLRYAAATQTPVQMFDLPCSISFACEKAIRETVKKLEEERENENKEKEQKDEDEEKEQDAESEESEREETPKTLAQELVDDPLGTMARVAGVKDFSEWEERAIEQSETPDNLFPELIEMCAVARSIVQKEGGVNRSREERFREATMRRRVREALKSGAERIAIVCGAWHAPVLDLENKERKDLIPSKKEDDATLSKLPKIKTTATWIPWTHQRIARGTGYGAAIESPGWFEALWTESKEKKLLDELCGAAVPEESEPIANSSAIVRWTTRAARCLRDVGFETLSTAEAIDAARIADSLAALRGRAVPNVEDARDAVLCVFGRCREEILAVVRDQLEIGVNLGSVPSTAPTVPLERDVELQIKKLRLKKTTLETLVKLDLREESGKKKSAFFYRLNLLGVPWATIAKDDVNAAGTFRECWSLRWEPEYVVRLVEASRLGSTVYDASSGAVVETLDKTEGIGPILDLFERALRAEIADYAVDALYKRIERDAALTYDVDELFEAIPPLVRLLRYGDARKSDVSRLRTLFDSLFLRLLLALPGACERLDEDAARQRSNDVAELTRALVALNDDERLRELFDVFRKIVDEPNAARSVSGKLTRILFEHNVYNADALGEKFGFFVSKTVDAPDVARWLESFLAGSGQTLLWLEAIWKTFNRWLASIEPDAFEELAPLLRRAFADFTAPEKKQMGKTVAKLKLTKESQESEAKSESEAPTSSGAPIAAENDLGTTLYPVLSFILGLDQDDANESAEARVLSFLSGNSEGNR